MNNSDEAVKTANTSTTNVFGVLGDIAFLFDKNGVFGSVRTIVSTITAEAEQNAYCRILQGKTPQEFPFTTVPNRDFAFTALQNVIDLLRAPTLATSNSGHLPVS